MCRNAEISLDRITGNKEAGRNNAFAYNFMPLLEGGTEFAMKWSALYTSYREEGIRDAIKVYEFMNRYYVQEGNKRVSVSKFGGSEFILADVIRIIPKRTDDKEVTVYYEYLDFYKSTKNIHIVFSEPGSYQKLASMLGAELGQKWDRKLCEDLNAAYFSFSDKCSVLLKNDYQMTMGDAFLMYISIFPMHTLFEDTKDQIIRNIKLAQREILSVSDAGSVEYVTQEETAEKNSKLKELFFGSKRYTEAAPLRVGFIYDADVDSSRWIDSHEAGRLYIDHVTEGNVRTNCYYTHGDCAGALERAIAAQNEIIFAVSPSMLEETLRAAVKHPETGFFCCSVGKQHPSVRCYHGKYYEAAFLAGILSADALLQEQTGTPRRIGYLVRGKDDLTVPSANAFAIGVSLIDPECRISLKCVGEQTDDEIRAEWAEQKITVYADIEQPAVAGVKGKAGICRIRNGETECIGVPFYQWGKYYEKIIHSVLSGTWRAAEQIKPLLAKNYWFGLSSGTVGIYAPQLPYQTRKMLSFFQTAIVSGMLDPFSGELHARDQVIQKAGSSQRILPMSVENSLPAEKIVSMNWLNDNIDGEISCPAES